jgi:GGDEF domain-containing protein
VEKFERINAEENRKYIISVSHGISVFKCGGDETIDEIVNQADAKMYEEKREIKKGLTVIRENAN